VKCVICQKRYVTLMCPDLDINKTDVDVAKSGSSAQSMTEVHLQLNCTNEVLQTLRSVVRNGNKSEEVRELLDPGSQKSYILEKTARQLGLESKGEIKVCHLLFGRHKEAQQHNLYAVERLSQLAVITELSVNCSSWDMRKSVVRYHKCPRDSGWPN